MATQLAPSLRTFLALPEEQRALGQYRLVAQLGSGGFAPVWLAGERYGAKELRKVAIKLFAIDRGDGGPRDDSREETIVEEAQALCNVEHPNVVRFYTFTKDASNQVLGLVMEYVRGVSLDRKLEERERLDHAEAVEIGIAIASALEAVHRVGLIHRDLKPANVIVSEGVYKLIDFGIASADRAQKPKGPHVERRVVLDDLPLEVAATKASMLASDMFGRSNDDPALFEGLAGTLGYMDPKCVATQSRATPASDFYALGATLFECVVGILPATFAAKYTGGYGLKGEVLDGRARTPSLAVAAPDAPPGLVALVDRLLDPEPGERPQTAAEIIAALEALRAGAGRAVTPPQPSAAELGATKPGSAPSGPAESRPNTNDPAVGPVGPSPSTGRSWVWKGAAGLVAVAVGAAAVTALTRTPAPAAASAVVVSKTTVEPAPVAPSPPVVATATAAPEPRVEASAIASHAPIKASAVRAKKTLAPVTAPVPAPVPAPATPAPSPAAPTIGVVEKSPY